MNYPLVQSVGVVVFDGDKVLLVRHGKAAHHFEGIIGLPSGKIDQGESAIEAAKRELHEETGLITQINDLIQLPKTYRATIAQKDGTKIFDWYVFYCRTTIGSLQATDETKPFWAELTELETLTLLPNVADAVREAMRIQHP